MIQPEQTSLETRNLKKHVAAIKLSQRNIVPRLEDEGRSPQNVWIKAMQGIN